MVKSFPSPNLVYRSSPILASLATLDNPASESSPLLSNLQGLSLLIQGEDEAMEESLVGGKSFLGDLVGANGDGGGNSIDLLRKSSPSSSSSSATDPTATARPNVYMNHIEAYELLLDDHWHNKLGPNPYELQYFDYRI